MKKLHLLIFQLLIATGLFGQGWDHTFDHVSPFDDERFSSVIATPDGGFAGLGYWWNSAQGNNNTHFLYKLDPDGVVDWDTIYDMGLYTRMWRLKSTLDGGYIMAGQEQDTSGGFFFRGALHKVDAFGNTEWFKAYRNGDFARLFDVEPTADSGYIAVGSNYQPDSIWVVRTDKFGDTLWTRSFVGPDLSAGSLWSGYRVRELPAGGFFVAANQRATGNNEWGYEGEQMNLFRLDAMGNIQWAKTYDPQRTEGVSDMVLTPSGGLVISGHAGRTINTMAGQVAWVLEVDAIGDSLSSYEVTGPSPTNQRAIGIHRRADNTYLIGGYQRTGMTFNDNGIFLMKLDANADSLWLNLFSYPLATTFFVHETFAPLEDHGLLLGGVGFGVMNEAMSRLIRYDSLGSAAANVVCGRVFYDGNGDCVPDSGQLPATLLIRVDPGPLYTYTNPQGYYSIGLDSGTYTVSLVDTLAYWDITCPATGSYQVSVDDSNVVCGNDFGYGPTVLCPEMRVSMGTPFLRWCNSQQIYTVQYTNTGTIAADSAYVVVEMDPFLQVDSASIPWTLPQSGNTYRFELGTVGFGTLGNFRIYTTLPCQGTVMGQTHCNRAYIYPDSGCLPNSPFWDGSSVSVQVECENNDSVRFTVRNNGQATMSQPSQVIVLEDNVMRYQVLVTLGPLQDTAWAEPANGSTWYIQASQSSGHPGNSNPSDAVEACGVNGNGGFSIGFLPQYPTDDADLFVDIDCETSGAAVDPNEKRNYPLGFDMPHFIEDDDEIEYTIHFQNTGTDTAFAVVIRDTLASYLDLASLQPGASSHPYQLQVVGNGILKFSFPGIELPDSNVNEPLSHGFVKFRIAQVPGNPVGTVIENAVGIYFDYQAPVQTNTVWNTIGEDFFGTVSVDDPIAPEAPGLSVYPNPFRDFANFELEQGVRVQDHYFAVYDLKGHMVHQQTLGKARTWRLQADALPAGIYFFRVWGVQGASATGKVILQR